MAKQTTVKKGTRTRKKVNRHVPMGIAHVKATFNNTVVCITDPAGNAIAWSSGGKSNQEMTV